MVSFTTVVLAVSGFVAAVNAGQCCSISIKRGATTIFGRDDNADIEPTFVNCMNQNGVTGTPKLVANDADLTMTISGVPATCINLINQYNAQSNIGVLQAKYGTIVPINGTAVHISGISQPYFHYLETTYN